VMRRMLSRTDLDALVRDLLGAGTRVIAPVRRKVQGREFVEYAPVQNPEEIALDGSQPVRPLKQVVFPPTETLFNYKQDKGLVQIQEAPTTFSDTLVIGARPCDAAALEIVDRVMDWDYHDEFWFGHRQATTVVAVACTDSDESCFCTAVGLSPESTRGADWLLIPAGSSFEVRVVTPKGEALLESNKSRCPESDVPEAGKASSAVEEKVRANLAMNPAKLQEWLGAHFEHPLWQKIALRCHGCGACAFVCPTCHCFDIVDELEGVGRGARRRNWDACQPALFTLHGSGHNPRKDQSARFRQRVMHKFSIYPSRFGEILCTGCGRCIRVCAAGMDLIAILAEIGQNAEEAGSTL